MSNEKRKFLARQTNKSTRTDLLEG